MKKIFGFIAALIISGQVFAYGDDSPPFSSLTCKKNNINIQVEIHHYRQTYGAGPASIKSGNFSWSGGWKWKAAEEGTRLAGHHFFEAKANNLHGQGPIYLRALYTPFGELGNGWLEMTGVSTSVDCQITKKVNNQNHCRVLPQNDCSVSTRRLCCDCINNQLSCY